MAIFPQGLTHVDARCNPGERRVLHQLKRCLEDDYLVWHDVPLGARSRQPDFVIVHPRWGVLLLEVKDWKKSTLGPGQRDRVEIRTPQGAVTVQHPLQQVRDAAMDLVDQMQRDPLLVHADGPFRGKLLFPYGWGVVMSHLHRRDVAGSDFDDVFLPRQTLLRDDLDDGLAPDAFQQRLWGMFTVHYPFTLSLPQRDRIRWHLFPEMRVLPAQQSLDPGSDEPDSGPAPLLLPDLMQVMDLQQEQVARSLGEGHRVIHGAAGSGKTMILVYRAQQLAATARADRPILVLCFNRALAGRIEAQLRSRGVDERVVVRTFHAWCADIVRSYQIDVPPAQGDDDAYALLAQAVGRAVDTGRVPRGQYAALLIDEAHDFEADWLRLAAQMVDPATRSLLVLYDDTQSIYATRRRRFSLASVGIEARGRTSVLKVNYRNTAEVLALAVACAGGLLLQGQAANDAAAAPGASAAKGNDTDTDTAPIVMPTTAGRRGPLPVLLQARHEREAAELLAERLQQAHAAGRPLRDMAVLSRTKRSMPALAAALRRRGLGVDCQATTRGGIRGFDWQADRIRLLTLHSVKGLEFPLVAIAALHELPCADESLEDAQRLLYVGMTRATGELLLCAHGHSPVVEQVQQALDRVRLGFARSA